MGNASKQASALSQNRTFSRFTRIHMEAKERFTRIRMESKINLGLMVAWDSKGQQLAPACSALGAKATTSQRRSLRLSASTPAPACLMHFTLSAAVDLCQ